jgi:hypothetical protein
MFARSHSMKPAHVFVCMHACQCMHFMYEGGLDMVPASFMSGYMPASIYGLDSNDQKLPTLLNAHA